MNPTALREITDDSGGRTEVVHGTAELSQATARIAEDWYAKYGHRVSLLETFVQRHRFAGTSYRAANWIYVGATTGRSRQDREHRLQVPLKDVYLYGLAPKVREQLCR